MAYLYLVAFKGQPYGREDDFNYALRELLGEHCSYTSSWQDKVFGPAPLGNTWQKFVGYFRRSDTPVAATGN